MSKSPSGNKPFGKIVASLRREKSLTQEDLSEKTSLDYDTIVNIENGRRARIESDILLNLADTFRLTSRERKEFFAAAIDISDERVVTKSKSEEILKRVLAMTEQIRLPVFVFDAYMDVVFANSVILTLLEVPENFVETADSKWSGYNVMRVVFDPKSGYKDLVGNENWDEVAISNIHLFRVATLRARHDKDRFEKILKELLKLDEFSRFWYRVQWELEDHYMDTENFGYMHRTHGSLEYFYLPTSIVTPHGDLHIVTYVPSNKQTSGIFESIFDELDLLRKQGQDIPFVRTFSLWPEKKHPIQ